MIPKKCVNGTEQNGQNCSKWENEVSTLEDEALEKTVWNLGEVEFRLWHIILLCISGVMCVVILLCCCIKFRIPRTKQEIEADYRRRKILRKFRQRLQAIQNQELDEMDLKKALDKIRAEFKSDTESLAQSDAGFSAATISSTGGPPPKSHGTTYRRASQIQIDISLEDLRAHSLGPKARIALALSRLCGRTKVSQSDKVALTVDDTGEAHLTVPEGAFKTKDKKCKPEPGGKESKVEAAKDRKDKVPTDKKDKSSIIKKEKDTAEKKDKSGVDKKDKNKPDKKDKTSTEVKLKEKDKAKNKDTVKPGKVAEKTMEVKGQAAEAAGTSATAKSSAPSKDVKKQKDDKKQKEREEKVQKKADKEKDRIEKERAKAEKTKLKIENEKAQKLQKDKVKEDKKKKVVDVKQKDAT